MVRRLVDQDAQREQRRQSILLDRLVLQFRGKVRKELSRAMNEAADFFEHTGEVPALRDHHARMTAIMAQMDTAAIKVMGIRVLQAAQGKAATDLEVKDFADTMAAIAIDYIAGELFRRRATSVTETTREQIVSAVDQGYAEGLGQRAVAGYIRERVPAFTAFRANLIARTETHGAANFGAFGAAKETGLVLNKEWISAEDDRTRPDHAAANGQIVGMDDSFDIGGEALMYPGDPGGSADQVINCRCTVAYVPDL
jgi:SPP1 gp7 family putative phage head morphogenesis protein